jgi:hypothetical protein
MMEGMVEGLRGRGRGRGWRGVERDRGGWRERVEGGL